MDRLRVGLGSLFFGLLYTHEQHLAVLTEPELRELLAEADRRTSQYEKRFAGHDHIAQYAKSNFDSQIADARMGADADVALKLIGRSDTPLLIYVFSDEEERCPHRYEEVPVFEGSTEVQF